MLDSEYGRLVDAMLPQTRSGCLLKLIPSRIIDSKYSDEMSVDNDRGHLRREGGQAQRRRWKPRSVEAMFGGRSKQLMVLQQSAKIIGRFTGQNIVRPGIPPCMCLAAFATYPNLEAVVNMRDN